MSDDMISVGSSQVELGAAFQGEARARIREAARKYFGHLTMAAVHVGREGGDFHCSVTIQMGGLAPATAEATAADVPLAFRQALAKVEKQLRRTKRALREDKPIRPDRVIPA